MPTARSFDPHQVEYRYVRRRWHLLFRVVDIIGSAVVRLFARCRAPSEDSLRVLDADSIRSILLVQLDHLGDSLITTAMLAPLRRHFPQASIEVLCGPRAAEVFRASPQIAKVHVSRVNRFHRRAAGLWMAATVMWGLRLRRRRFDLSIDIRGELPMAMLLALAGARHRLGWDAGGGGFLLTASPKYVRGRAELASRAALLAEIGVPIDETTFLPHFEPGPAAVAQIERRLGGAAYDARRKLLVLHIGAGTSAKAWPRERWRSLVCSLVSRELGEVVLVGSTADRAAAAEIAAGFSSDYVRDWTGQLELVELAALCRRADVVVGADSGPAHLAAALRTSVVVLFSGTNEVEQWQPRGSRVLVLNHPVPCKPCHATNCPLADHPCMRGIDPATVFERVAELLDEPLVAFAEHRERADRNEQRRAAARSLA